ncbi:MAG TPA: glucosidase [Thermoanaerobaculia bacterium]
MTASAESARLATPLPWRKWGPYLADRAWGTVREDYSADGNPWKHFPHEQARSKAYRWGEDGIAGFSDRYQILCWSLALWNERDAILKERFFGLVPSEANHGEDAKEYWFYVDALPSHAYQRMLYKYPQAAYPYQQLIDENRRRGRDEPEYELLDTGIFDGDRYFDVEIEIAKADAETLVFRITAHNRGPERAPLHLLPHLWFRNTWGWGPEKLTPPAITLREPGLLLADDSHCPPLGGLLHDTRLGPHVLEYPKEARGLFTDNETNVASVYGIAPQHPFVKDAFHRFIVNGEQGAVNPEQRGTKACVWQRYEVDPGASVTMELTLRPDSSESHSSYTSHSSHRVAETIATRRAEADAFYATIHKPRATAEERNIQRQALAGMLWNKQSYLFDVDVWLDGDNPNWPPPPNRQQGRNSRWRHLNSMRILSMPDKWEYPWFATWDLAFHAVVLALVDCDFAKEQLWIMLFEQFQHPNGQIPAYEWEFSDLNPPVQAWAVWRIYNMDRIRNGRADREFLERCFHKLLLNFTWWVNKVDHEGNNVFEGGFLGLDNITLVDRSEKLPHGAILEQSDATGWMGMFSLVMMRIALDLAKENDVYEGLATKFFEHYVYIGAAMKMVREGHTLWDEADNFFYDLLRFPDGTTVPFRIRSLVGLIPLYAIERLESKWFSGFAHFKENLDWFLHYRRDVAEHTVTTVQNGGGEFTHVLAIVDQNELQHLLNRIVDPEEFLSRYGIRSLSRFHDKNPFRFEDRAVGYEPAETTAFLKGGNSNWRGPIWFPTTFLLIESLRKLEKAFGGTVTATVHDADDSAAYEPTTDTRAHEGIGAVAGDHRARGHALRPTAAPPARTVTLSGVAARLAERQIRIFLPDADGYRPVYGPRGTRKAERFAHDPHWRGLVLFHEYFHGDTGEGLGASHQTGWTGLVASLIDEWR